MAETFKTREDRPATLCDNLKDSKCTRSRCLLKPMSMRSIA